MLVQHPVPLLLVFLCLQVRSMKLSNARAASSSAAARLPLPEDEKHETEQCSYIVSSSTAARIPLPEGEKHETEECHHMLLQHPVPLLLVFLCLRVRTMKLSNAIICSYNIQFRCCSSSFACR
jgi:hypothetical protein